jgi:hypothetical protein
MRFAVAIVAAGLGALVLMMRASDVPPIITDSDLAVTELYVELASRGHLDVGPYSRFGWHHPGPLYFYLQAPLYAMWGRGAVSLFLGAALINLVFLTLTVWACTRQRGGVGLGVGLAAGLLVFAWRVPMLLASPWTGHVAVVAVVAFITLCSLATAGRRWMLPLALVAGGFVAQTHVSFVPVIAVLGLVTVISVAMSPARPGHRAAVLWAALAALVVPWSIPIMEAASNGGGNAADLWTFFVARGEMVHPLSSALAHWSHGLTMVFHPEPTLPWGGHLSPVAAAWTVPLAVTQTAALLVIAAVTRRSGRRLESATATSCGLAALVGLWSVTRIEGAVLDHEVFWLGALGAVNMGVIVATAIGAAARRWPVKARAGAVDALGGSAIAAFAALSLIHFTQFTSAELRRSDRARIPATFVLLRDHVASEGLTKPLFRFQGDAWSEGAGIVLRWLQAGKPLAVDPAATAMFTNRFTSTGEEDAEVTLSSREGQHDALTARPGNVVLRDRHPLFVDVVPLK